MDAAKDFMRKYFPSFRMGSATVRIDYSQGRQAEEGWMCRTVYFYYEKLFFFCLNAGHSAILSISQSALIAFDAIYHEVLKYRILGLC